MTSNSCNSGSFRVTFDSLAKNRRWLLEQPSLLFGDTHMLLIKCRKPKPQLREDQQG